MYGGIELDGRYRLEDRLGRGGMGEVWRGTDLKLDRQVAVKLLLGRNTRSTRRIELFRREVEITAALQHPGITVVHDVGEHDGCLYFVMELIEGRDLARILAGNPDGLPIERVRDIGVQVADALAFAHLRGIVHRDVKPANIMVSPDGRVRVCDFGVARILHDIRGENVTAGVGTSGYVAPEQYDGEAGARSDLYSLGCVLHELTTGRPVFRGTPFELMDRHRNEIPAALTTLAPDVPVELETLVLDLLAKRVHDRPSEAGEVRDRLEGIRGLRRAIVEDPEVRSGTDPLVLHRVDGHREPPPSRLLASGSPPKKWTSHNERIAGVVQQVLTDHRVDARVAGVVRGPTVGRYEVRLAPAVDRRQVTELLGRMSRSLGGVPVAMLGSVPSSSPLPGGSAVGLEIPHPDPDVVGLGGVLRSTASERERAALPIGLGRAGEGSVLMDLAEAPHLLITGGPGSGKSTAVRTVVGSLLAGVGPASARLVLIETGGGALSEFSGVPHLLTHVIDDAHRGMAALGWVLGEMERRYDDLAAHGFRTVATYNAAVRDEVAPPPVDGLGGAIPHPSIVVVVDELADLTAYKGRKVERVIGRLARVSRAVGIHMVLATRETSARVLTDRVRAEIPARLAFKAPTVEAAEVGIDGAGSERLQCPGDALYLPKGAAEATRMRCAMVSGNEIRALVAHWGGRDRRGS